MSDSATSDIPRTIAREEDDDQMELLMRHSSPFTTREGAVTSPLTERNISPSLARPRSNPRNRTPMRYTSPLHSEAFRIPEEDPPMGRGGITIRPMAGRAVGTSTRARAAFQSVSCSCTVHIMYLKRALSALTLVPSNNDTVVWWHIGRKTNCI